MEIIRSNLQRTTPPLQHVLIVAPRGGGKTTFLRHLEQAIRVESDISGRTATAYVSTLEVGTAGPDHYIDRLAASMSQQTMTMALNFGLSDEASWDSALGRLSKAQSKSSMKKRTVGVLLIDSFEEALKRAFHQKDAQSRLRRLLQSNTHVMLIGAVNSAEVQQDYDERLFQAFLEIELPEFTPSQIVRLCGTNFSGRMIGLLAEFIGGSPERILRALDALVANPALSGGELVRVLAAREGAAFETRLDELPIRQRRVLDALLTSGEPNRPTRLAELLGTNQADIADAIRYLLQDDIIKRTPESTTRRVFYAATDRLLAFWYAEQRGIGPSYLADLIDIVAFARGLYVGSSTLALDETNTKKGRAAAYQELEDWISGQKEKRQAGKIAVPYLVRTRSEGLLEDAADLFEQIGGPQNASSDLLRFAATQKMSDGRVSPHPDIGIALRLLRAGSG